MTTKDLLDKTYPEVQTLALQLILDKWKPFDSILAIAGFQTKAEQQEEAPVESKLVPTFNFAQFACQFTELDLKVLRSYADWHTFSNMVDTVKKHQHRYTWMEHKADLRDYLYQLMFRIEKDIPSDHVHYLRCAPNGDKKICDAWQHTLTEMIVQVKLKEFHARNARPV